jgi:peptidoglycan hydrolase-like protein with peptidoglycan-binding domain
LAPADKREAEVNQRLRLTAVMLSLALLLPGLAQAKTHKTAKSKSTHAAKGKRAAKKPRGQQAMNTERVREIQSALIREHYLQGEPNGLWDTRSKAAMQKFQADQGWQSKVVPDSRALIKLGLGPDHANLLNPDTAAIAAVPGGGAPRVSETPEK